MELAFLALIPYENVIGKDTTMNIRKTLQSGTTAINASLDHPEIKPAISFGNYGWYGKALVEHTVGTSQWSVSLTNHDCIRLAAALIVAERRAKRAENRSRSENKPLPTADSFKRRLDEAIALIETDFPDPSATWMIKYYRCLQSNPLIKRFKLASKDSSYDRKVHLCRRCSQPVRSYTAR